MHAYHKYDAQHLEERTSKAILVFELLKLFILALWVTPSLLFGNPY